MGLFMKGAFLEEEHLAKQEREEGSIRFIHLECASEGGADQKARAWVLE